MNRSLERVRRWLRADDGPTAVEYAVLLGVIIGTLFASVSRFGLALGAYWQMITSAIVAGSP